GNVFFLVVVAIAAEVVAIGKILPIKRAVEGVFVGNVSGENVALVVITPQGIEASFDENAKPPQLLLQLVERGDAARVFEQSAPAGILTNRPIRFVLQEFLKKQLELFCFRQFFQLVGGLG